MNSHENCSIHRNGLVTPARLGHLDISTKTSIVFPDFCPLIPLVCLIAKIPNARLIVCKSLSPLFNYYSLFSSRHSTSRMCQIDWKEILWLLIWIEFGVINWPSDIAVSYYCEWLVKSVSSLNCHYHYHEAPKDLIPILKNLN